MRDGLPSSSSRLVISPLQSLMLDQVTKLKKVGISAAATNAGQSALEPLQNRLQLSCLVPLGSNYCSNTESCNVPYVVLESQVSTFLFSIHHSNLCIHDININVQYSFTSCSKISDISEISAFLNMPYVYSKTWNSRIFRKSRNELFLCKKAHILYDIHFTSILLEGHSVIAIARGISVTLSKISYTFDNNCFACKKHPSKVYHWPQLRPQREVAGA